MDFINETPLKEPLIFDTHAHFDDRKFDGIREELLKKLPHSGVKYVINCGCDGESSKKAKELAERFDYIYFAAGVHPENLDSKTPLTSIETLANHPKCVAIGEIGLDYYWRGDNKAEQLKVFEEQLVIAKKLGLPVIIHDREAHEDTLNLLKKHRPKGVLHGFSGSVEMAREILKIGMYVGVGGVITFKNAKKLPDVVDMLPIDRIVFETDCPYMAPVPYRGKINNSAMIYFIAQKTAEIKGISVEEMLQKATENSKKLFFN